MSFTNLHFKKIQRSQIWRTKGPGHGPPSCYLTIKKLSVQKGKNAAGGV